MKNYLFVLLFSLVSLLLAADLEDGLTAYYPFNGNAEDESSNNYDGIVVGAELCEDRFGNDASAYKFDDGHKITVNITGSGNWSFNCWVNVYNNSQNAQILTDSPSISTRIAQHLFTEKYGITEYGEADYVFTGNSQTRYNQWVMLTYVCTSGNCYLYLNDQYIGYVNHTFDFNIKTFGADLSEEDTIHGILDDVYIYNRALSGDDIDELYFQADFIAAESVYNGETIEFTDISTGEPNTWAWDFENDGVYDDFTQNPVHVYDSVGTYSVKLRINNGTYTDSLVKYDYVTVNYCPPASPDSLQIEVIENDAIISWTEVDTTECGTYIEPDGYIVCYNESGYSGDEFYYFLTFTTETAYLHEFVAEYSSQMFYKIKTVKNFNEVQINYLENLSKKSEKVKWLDIKYWLNKLGSK